LLLLGIIEKVWTSSLDRKSAHQTAAEQHVRETKPQQQQQREKKTEKEMDVVVT
jgi:hypothetical protein